MATLNRPPRLRAMPEPPRGTDNGRTDRTPPHDPEVERYLIGQLITGAAMQESSVAEARSAGLAPEHFYTIAYQSLCAAVYGLVDEGAPVTTVSVASRVEGTSSEAVEAICAGAGTLSDLGWFTGEVLRHAGARRRLAALSDAVEAAWGGDEAGIATALQRVEEQQGPSLLEWPDLGAVFDPGFSPPQPTMLRRSDGRHLVYPAAFTLIYGPPGLGKTNVGLWLTLERIRLGRHVLYLDWESSWPAIGYQLRNLGATREQCTELVHYARPAALTPPVIAELLGAEAELCIIDGLAKSLAASGWDEDRAADFLAWVVALVTPMTDAGMAVVVNDHVTKSPDGRDWARGTGAKLGEVSGAAYEIRRGTPYNRRQAGFVTLVQRKDRHGQVGSDGQAVADVHFTPGRDGFLGVEVRTAAQASKDHATAVLLERLYGVVARLAATESLIPTTSVVADTAGVGYTRTADALKHLRDLGHLGHEKGPRNSDIWSPLAPYVAPALESMPGYGVPSPPTEEAF